VPPTLIKDFDFAVERVSGKETVAPIVCPDLLAIDNFIFGTAVQEARYGTSFGHPLHQFSENVEWLAR
jgi:hypothetical protein